MIFQKLTKSPAAEVRKMTMGVVRTTVAAALTSMGAFSKLVLEKRTADSHAHNHNKLKVVLGTWIIVAFFMLSYTYSTAETSLLDNAEFSSIFG